MKAGGEKENWRAHLGHFCLKLNQQVSRVKINQIKKISTHTETREK